MLCYRVVNGVLVRGETPRPVRHDPRQALLRTLLSLADSPEDVAPGFSGVAGSQMLGVVEQAPDERPELRGVRVVVSPVESCGSCEICRGGAASACLTRRMMGIHGLDGGLAEFVIADHNRLTLVPDNLADHDAVFAFAAARAKRLSGAVSGQRNAFITVLGDRPFAIMTAQMLSRRFDRVRIVGHGVGTARECERRGLRFRLLDEIGRRHDQHAVIDCSGGLLANVAVRLLRPKGQLIGSVLSPCDWSFEFSELVRLEATATGVCGGTIAEGLGVIAEGAVDCRGLSSSTVHAPATLAQAGFPATLVEFRNACVPGIMSSATSI